MREPAGLSQFRVHLLIAKKYFKSAAVFGRPALHLADLAAELHFDLLRQTGGLGFKMSGPAEFDRNLFRHEVLLSGGFYYIVRVFPARALGKINLMNSLNPRYPVIKRIFDLLFSLLALLVLSPVLVLLVFVLLIFQGLPLFFTQERPGLGGQIFRLVKFRSMQPSPGNEDNPDQDALRITRLGSFLRRTSLDELPELINVLKGEMSIVGPRPLLVQYLGRYSAEQARRHELPPGITGWAQVNGRNALTWEQRFALDVWYVDHWSLWLDIRIILMTIGKVLRGEGVSQPGRATMDEFMGKDEGK